MSHQPTARVQERVLAGLTCIMSEEYKSRLNRAIEMELTFQAAAAGGMKLTPEQKRRVDGVAQRHKATLQEYRKQVVTWSLDISSRH